MRIHLLLLAVAVALAGCAQSPPAPPTDDADDGTTTAPGDGEGQPPAPVREATFTAVDYAFQGPSEVSADWVKLTLLNNGAEPHEIFISAIDEGDFDDFRALVEQDANGATEDEDADGQAPGEGLPVPGVGSTHPDRSSTSFVLLEPGEYAFACWIPAPDGEPHAFKGMIAPLTVTPAEPNPEPGDGDVTLAVEDGNVTMEPAFGTGPQRVKAVNRGTDFEADYLGLQLVQLQGNATAQDFLEALRPNGTAPPAGPPPGHAWGGLTGLPGGTTAFFEVDLVPGRYAFVSFDMEPRQVAEFEVRGPAA